MITDLLMFFSPSQPFSSENLCMKERISVSTNTEKAGLLENKEHFYKLNQCSRIEELEWTYYF
jgi:hypothetical protein